MLPPAAVPKDSLCRVIVDYYNEDSEATSNIHDLLSASGVPASHSYPKLIGLATAALCNNNSRFWCVGEVTRREAVLLRREATGPIVTIEVDRSDDLILYRLDSKTVDADTVWPSYTGDQGFRLFVFDSDENRLESDLLKLQKAIHQNKDAALQRWREIRRASLIRSKLAEMCQEMVVCVMPDGPYFNEVAFHSIRRQVHEITSSLCSVAEQNHIGCSIVPNLGDEYQALLKNNAPQAVPSRTA